MKLHFSAPIKILGVNPYVEVSAVQAQELQAGWRKPIPLLVQVNGVPDPPWSINMMPCGDGSFNLYLAGPVRQASNTGVGDTIQVDLAFDESYRPGPDELPAWFAGALERDEVASANWAVLAPSRRKEVVRYLRGVKSPEAQARNLQRVMAMLGGAEGHWMGRDWKDGR